MLELKPFFQSKQTFLKPIIFQGYGVRSDGKILFINASTCDINYLPCNPAVVFDVGIPEGHTREEDS